MNFIDFRLCWTLDSLPMPLKKIKKIIFPLFLLIIIMGFFIGAKIGYAQENLGFGYATALNLGTRDIRSIIISIINIFLGFLGIVAIIIILYGGYVYMTSAGDPNTIEKAKKILINGVIGLGIIFFSWAIVMFVFRMFGIGSGGGEGHEGGGGISIGPGALGKGIIESHYPERSQRNVPRNTMIVVTFKEEINPATIISDTNGNATYGDCVGAPLVCDTLFDIPPADGIADSIKIFKNIDGEAGALIATDVKALTTDNKTFVFMPVNPPALGSATEEFWYTVRLKDSIKKAGGEDAFSSAISGTGYEWQFEVSTIMDVTPPQIESIIPYPDDSFDTYTNTGSAQAIGSITVASQPNTYIASSVSAVTAATPTSPSATTSGNYAGSVNDTITVTINNGAANADVNWTTSTENDNSSAVISNNSIALGSGLTLLVDPGYMAGNRWTFSVTSETQPDYLRVGSTSYKFVTSGASGNEINLGATANDTAANIANKIDEQSIIETPDVTGNLIDITATTAGSAGNSIALVYNSPDGAVALTITPMSGGTSAGESQTIADKRDQPRNVVVQINFNEAVNPITTTGEVSIVDNGDGDQVSSTLAGGSFDIILPSIDIGGTDEYIAGNWVISNQYRTVEFITKDKCGVNSCGEDVYCLPTDPLNESMIEILDTKQGTVTASMVDTVAFINDDGQDFSTYAGAGGSSKDYMIVVTDSSGNKARGYIGEQGSGETFGGELVTNGDNETSIAIFDEDIASGGTAAQSNEQANNGIYSMKMKRTGGTTGNVSRRVVDSNLSVVDSGDLVDIDFSIYNSIGGTVYLYAQTQASGYDISSQTISTNNTWRDTNTRLTIGTQLYLQLISWKNNTEYFYIDDLSIKKVLTPTTAGVKIYSTKDGSTQSWESADAGFNANTIASYEIRKSEGTGNLTLGNISIEVKAAQGANLPTANFPFDGVIDMAANSLDGNRDGTAVGPGGNYDENTDAGPGDNYSWSFWVNSKVDLTPPVIEEIFPSINGIISLTDPIEIKFSKLIMSSTLKPDSGYADGKDHVALIDTSINPAGYWVNSQNIDESVPPDNIPDKTKTFINHTSFMPSTNYSAEVGEGVRDLYQNCFMPAADLGTCAGADATDRSCCNGVLTNADECP